MLSCFSQFLSRFCIQRWSQFIRYKILSNLFVSHSRKSCSSNRIRHNRIACSLSGSSKRPCFVISFIRSFHKTSHQTPLGRLNQSSMIYSIRGYWKAKTNRARRNRIWKWSWKTAKWSTKKAKRSRIVGKISLVAAAISSHDKWTQYLMKLHYVQATAIVYTANWAGCCDKFHYILLRLTQLIVLFIVVIVSCQKICCVFDKWINGRKIELFHN